MPVPNLTFSMRWAEIAYKCAPELPCPLLVTRATSASVLGFQNNNTNNTTIIICVAGLSQQRARLLLNLEAEEF
jgi:hypothetical protein